jgi:hypothetical protein
LQRTLLLIRVIEEYGIRGFEFERKETLDDEIRKTNTDWIFIINKEVNNMAGTRCPGQNTQFWGPNDVFDIACPGCGKKIEFFKDEAQRKCKGCDKLVFNPRMDFGCANWCPMAKECLGQEKYEGLREIAQTEARRRADLEALLATIDPADEEVNKLFRQLYLQNKGGNALFNTEQLHPLTEENPQLFKKATGYYSRFMKTKAKSE